MHDAGSDRHLARGFGFARRTNGFAHPALVRGLRVGSHFIATAENISSNSKGQLYSFHVIIFKASADRSQAASKFAA